MEIDKGTRHQKIVGDFGEALVCNWLSRSGFEVTLVDHTGIDVVGYNPLTDQRLGIAVKSRTRRKGREHSSVNLMSNQKEKSDRDKVVDACKAFACEPWIGIYVESTEFADLFLLSLEHYDERYRGNANRAIDDWKMGPKHRELHSDDQELKHIHMDFLGTSWNWT
mgnify:CR=1 FL=1